MATTIDNYAIKIDVKGQQELDKLNKNVGSLSTGIGKLKGILATVGFGALIGSSIRWADSIQSVADATGIATFNVLGFSQAVVEAGGSVDGANNAILRLSQSIGEARDGSKSAQDAFAKVGITLNELETLSNRLIFQKVVEGLGQIDDVSRQAAAAADLFGKTLRGVEIGKVSSQFNQYSEANKDNAAAVKSAADAQEQLDKALFNVNQILLKIISPLTEFLAKLDLTSEKVLKIIEEIKYWGSILIGVGTAFLIFTHGARLALAFASALRNVGIAVETIQGSILTLSIWLSRFGKIGQIASDIVAGFGVALSRIINLAPKFADKLALWTAEYRAFIAAAGGAYIANKLLAKQAEDFSKPLLIPGVSGGTAADAQEYLQRVREKKQADKDAAAAKAAADAAAAKERITQINTERQEQFKLMNEQLANDALLGFQEQERAKNAEKMRNLYADIALFNQEISTKTGLQQLAAQNELIGLYGREYAIKQELLNIDAERINTINDVIANLRSMGTEATAEDVERATREIELAQIVADERLRIFNERMEKEKAVENSWTEGVKASFKQIADSMTPFTLAQDRMAAVFDNMSRALDTFVRTGKFKFSDFARSVIADILAIQAKAALVSLFKTIGLSLFPGLATGGPAQAGRAYMVGERGPELFIPKTAGEVIPNDQLNAARPTPVMQSQQPIINNYNNYNINAVDAKSVAQLFAENRKTLLGTVRLAEKEMPYA